MDARTEPIIALNGVRLRSHQLAAGVVRAEAEAQYRLANNAQSNGSADVELTRGVLWLAAGPGDHGLSVVIGANRVRLRHGAAVVEAGYSGETLVLVTDGVAVVTNQMGGNRALRAGEVGMVDADGSVSAVDEVTETELADDAWIVANRTLDATESTRLNGTADLLGSQAEQARSGLVTSEVGPGQDSPDEMSTVGVGAAVAGATAPEQLWSSGRPDPTGTDMVHVPDFPADPIEPRNSLARRRAIMAAELALLAAVLVIGVVIVGLYNRKDKPVAGPASIGSATSVVAPTAPAPTDPPATSPAPSSTVISTTAPPVPAATAIVSLKTCSRQAGGDTLLATGSAKGGNASDTEYAITVAVVQGSRTFGQTTVKVPVKADGGEVPFQVKVTVKGDTARAQCKITQAAIT